MSQFLRLLGDSNKSSALLDTCTKVRNGTRPSNFFELSTKEFDAVPGRPFAYWISDAVRDLFRSLSGFEPLGGTVEVGLQTSDDNRFVRLWTEISANERWINFSKGGAFAKWYSDPYLVVKSEKNFEEIVSFQNDRYPYLKGNARSLLHADISNFQRSGLTWPLRAKAFGPRVLPLNCAFSIRGYAAFPVEGRKLSTLALFNSSAFDYLFKVALGRFGFPEFLVGVLQRLPWITVNSEINENLNNNGLKAWRLQRTLDTIEETSHAFLLPSSLRSRIGNYDPQAIEAGLAIIQAEIDAIAFDLYGFSELDRLAAQDTQVSLNEEDEGAETVNDEDEVKIDSNIDQDSSLLSWATGVVFGRFDWRLATGEREAPPEPEPFDPLPAKSPGMLPDGAEPFHHHAGILVDDEGHQHDLPRLVEQVLETVDAPVSQDVRRWLRKDFFPFHLQQYSKSRRKAPIYWPLSTASGSYTLWLYYPELTNQTLFTAVNDFLEGESGKLSLVKQDVAALRNKGSSRTKQEEKELEKLEDLEQELADLRDTLLEIAPGYRPNQDDGVQITAAPLWSLFRHKPWQKVLKDTWKQLEKGDYDWAHLALNYWPDRLLRKCHEDRSLAIAHDVEDEFWEEVEVPVIRRGKDTGETKLEWQPKDLSEAQLQALINQVRQERSL